MGHGDRIFVPPYFGRLRKCCPTILETDPMLGPRLGPMAEFKCPNSTQRHEIQGHGSEVWNEGSSMLNLFPVSIKNENFYFNLQKRAVCGRPCATKA